MSACSITASCTDRDDRLGGASPGSSFSLASEGQSRGIALGTLDECSHSWFEGYRAEKGARKERLSSKRKEGRQIVA